MFLKNCIYLWLCWIFVAACVLSLVGASGVCPPSCGAWTYHWWLLLLESLGSGSRRLQWLWHMGLVAPWRVEASWTPGIEPVSPALAGEALTTGPPGKFYLFYLYMASQWQSRNSSLYLLAPGPWFSTEMLFNTVKWQKQRSGKQLSADSHFVFPM